MEFIQQKKQNIQISQEMVPWCTLRVLQAFKTIRFCVFASRAWQAPEFTMLRLSAITFLVNREAVDVLLLGV